MNISMNFSGNNVWISHIEVVGIYERVQLNVNPNKNLDLVVLNVLFDIGLGLIRDWWALVEYELYRVWVWVIRLYIFLCDSTHELGL